MTSPRQTLIDQAVGATGDRLPAIDQVESYDMRLDPEAMVLSALMWSVNDPYGDVNTVLSYLHPADFYRPCYGQLFSLMRDCREQGCPLDPTVLHGKIMASDRRKQWQRWDFARVLIDLHGLQAVPAQLSFFADQVLGEAYRRNFQSMVVRLAQMGREAPEEELFPELVRQGTQQRRAWERRAGLEQALAQSGEDKKKDD